MSAPTTDVLVIGAGVQGVGVAQAASAAGHRVLLLEQTTIAAGTSSKSSKLIHGGLRYLESMQLRLVRESLRERRILLTIAPHLVQLVPFFIPIYRETRRRPWQIRAGLSLYSMLGGLRQETRFQQVPREAWETLDGLRTEGLQAVYRYHDGQTDDAALCRAVAASAVDLGAEVILDAEVIAGERQANGWSVRYRVGSEVHEVLCSAVINATGPWVNRVLDHFTPGPPRRDVELVGGTHIELEGQLDQGIYYTESPTDQRAVFMMPWKDRTLVGTTETPYRGDPSKYGPTWEEVQYLRETLRTYFPERDREPLRAWAGLRVLPRGEGRTFRRSREVILVSDDARRPTLITIYGGKLTGYRATAERVLRSITPTLLPAERKADTATLALPTDPLPADS